MEQRGNQLLSSGVCSTAKRVTATSALALKPTIIWGCFLSHASAAFHWLFDFVVGSLAAQATKPVTLGPPLQKDLQPAARGGSICRADSEPEMTTKMMVSAHEGERMMVSAHEGERMKIKQAIGRWLHHGEWKDEEPKL